MNHSFVLIEQDEVASQEVNLLITQCFSSAHLMYINAEDATNHDALNHNIDWVEQDVVLVDCSISLEAGIDQLQRIKWITPRPSVLLFSDQQAVKQAALTNGADNYFYCGETWEALGAKINALINLRHHLNAFPFRLNDWCLLEVLHNSKDSAVYKAVNQEGELAAIKHYKYPLNELSDDFIDQFLSDLDKFSEIKTPRLVQIYDSGISNNVLYHVMEFMAHGALSDKLIPYQHLPLPQAMTWFFEIVYALHVVHQTGLLHRDLKPANIMLRADNTIALNDYGTATSLLVKAGFIAEDEISCSPYYVSPERILDEPSGVTSDIYSLGIIFYELLIGDKPYLGSTELELMMQHILAPIPILPDEYAGYQSLLNKMLAKDETQRLQRVIDVGSYLGS